MTDNSMESAQSQGAEGSPVPNASGAGVSQPSAADVEALKRALQPFIEETAAKVAQSTKDKRFAKQEQRLDDFESRLTQYKDLIDGGLTEKQALQYMRLERLINEAGDKAGAEVQPGVQAGSHAPAATSVDEQAVLNRLGLSANDPEVSRILRETKEPSERLAAFAELKVKSQVSNTPINPAQVMPGSGGTTVALTKERLYQEYRDSIKNVPVGDAGTKARMDARIAIRAKAAEAGIESPV